MGRGGANGNYLIFTCRCNYLVMMYSRPTLFSHALTIVSSTIVQCICTTVNVNFCSPNPHPKLPFSTWARTWHPPPFSVCACSLKKKTLSSPRPLIPSESVDTLNLSGDRLIVGLPEWCFLFLFGWDVTVSYRPKI